MVSEEESQVNPNAWEMKLPDFIVKKRIRYRKKEANNLMSKAEKEHDLSFPESVSFIHYTQGLEMSLSDYSGGKQILDAGSGAGNFRSALQKVGVDSTVINLDDIQTYGKNSPNVDVQGHIDALPFANESFDVVVARYALPWVTDKDTNPKYIANQLKELFRVLKKGGTLKYCPLRLYGIFNDDPDPNRDPFKALYEEAINQLKIFHDEDPALKITLTRAYEDDGKSFDEILEIKKPENP